MRLTRLLGPLIAAMVMATACTGGSAPRQQHRPTTAAESSITGIAALTAGLSKQGRADPYYLSLGDSLAQGIQPARAGGDEPTTAGYPDVLAARLRSRLPGLQLVKLGCSGETTATMIHGGICRYQAGSQLAEATAFLRSHRGRVALITIDIGANDPNSCVIGQPVSHMFRCLSGRVTEVQRNIDTILSRIRSAAGPRVLIIGMTYYVPELALWRRGQGGKQLALLTEGLAAGVDQLLIKRYRQYGARVANVFTAFMSADFGRRKSNSLPPNVRRVCALTWMCAPRPQGPNEHANDAGYRVIAGSFWQAIKD
ncbi:MAG TPA: SGNH/GDSL hydrolase family protein [Streptosporangiaceae bacterium]|nr:SGNH/GDSL hydrolase family protein [Streptosporangiaceae bacterium]